MLRVLLVDDELLARNHVRSLIDWERHGFVISGEAEEGVEAMRAMDRNKPHIAIIDVNMPNMDGVSLCRYISRYRSEIKVIVLSSYDKYEYVRDTLKNGAIDYLLKHRLDEDALLQVLDKARSEIGIADAAAFDAGRGGVQEREEPPVSLLAVLEWLQGRDVLDDSVQKWLERRWTDMNAQSGLAVVMQLANFRLLTETLPDSERTGIVRSIVELCEQSGNDGLPFMSVPSERGEIALLFFCDRRNERSVVQDIQELLRRIEHVVELYMGMKAVFGIGSVVRRSAGLRSSYREAGKQAEERLLALNTGRTGRCPEAGGEEAYSALTVTQEKALWSSVEAKDIHTCEEVLRCIVSGLQSGEASTRSIQNVISELISIADKFWHHHLAGGRAPESDEWMSRGELSRRIGLDELLQWLQERYRQLIGRLVSDRNRPDYSSLVRQAILYIRERFSSDVSLDQAARHVGVSPSYLSHLFKEETGTSFTEYLNRVRIGYSKRLIDGGECRIKDVYGKAGFVSYNYFFKVFKQYEGVTPAVYLKRKSERNVSGSGST